MYIVCSKEKLLNGLGLVARTVSSKSSLPILECILMTAGGEVFPDNERSFTGVRLTANDLEMSIETATIEAEVRQSGNVAIDAKLLLEIARKMPADYIEIETDDNNLTVFRSGRAKFKVLGMAGDEFPVMPELDLTQNCYVLKAVELKEMIRQTIFSVATDETKLILTGELMEYKDNCLRMVAVDGFRVAFRQQAMEAGLNPMKVVVPSKALNELSRILPSDKDTEVRFYFTDKRIVFMLPEFTFISRLLEGEFMRYDQIFNEDFTTIVTADRLSLLTGVERAILIARENKKSPVKLTIQDTVILTSKTEIGETYDEIPADIDGQPLEIAFNPRYLIDAFRASDDEKIVLKFTTALSPSNIKGGSSNDCKFLILPLRVIY